MPLRRAPKENFHRAAGLRKSFATLASRRYNEIHERVSRQP
jgi:hypothetical protein